MTDLETIAYLNAPEPEGGSMPFDAAAALSHLRSPLKELLPYYASPGRSALFVYTGDEDLSAVGRGIAAAAASDAQVFRLRSDEIEPEDVSLLLDSLLSGRTIVLLCPTSGHFGARLAAYWPEFCEEPRSLTVAINWDLTLGPHLTVDEAGAVIVVQTSAVDRSLPVGVKHLQEPEAADLASLGDGYQGLVREIGLPVRVPTPARCDRAEGSTTDGHRPSASIEARPSWREVFDRYVALERRWTIADAPDGLARQLFRTAVHRHAPRGEIRREVRRFSLPPLDDDLLDEALSLQRCLNPPEMERPDGSKIERPDGRTADRPLEDVYAAALSMLPHGFWTESPDRSQLYRGQRKDTFRTQPTIFRQSNLTAGLQELDVAIERIRRVLPHLDDQQALATAQHYSSELGVATWLLDVTWDPRVALFFASAGGQTGDIGCVTCIIPREWESLSAGGANRLGALRTIDVSDVLRIERQRASFLESPHQDLFDLYVAHTVWFRQIEGVEFEDPEALHPITRGYIYPNDDTLLTRLLGVETSPQPPPFALRPPRSATEELCWEDYFELTQSWLRTAKVKVDLDTHHERILGGVCKVFADIQPGSAAFPLEDRSLHRLREAARAVFSAQHKSQPIALREAMGALLGRFHPESESAVRLTRIIDRHADTVDGR